MYFATSGTVQEAMASIALLQDLLVVVLDMIGSRAGRWVQLGLGLGLGFGFGLGLWLPLMDSDYGDIQLVFCFVQVHLQRCS